MLPVERVSPYNSFFFHHSWSSIVENVRGCFQYAGDVAFRIFDAVNSVKRRALRKVDEDSLEETQIYVCDINPNMLNVGKQRAAERGQTSDFCFCIKSLTFLIPLYFALCVCVSSGFLYCFE